MEQLKEFYGVGSELAKKLWEQLLDHKIIDVNKSYTHAQLRRILARKSIFDSLPESDFL